MASADREGFDGPTLIALAVTLACWASAFAGIRAGLAGYSPGHLALLRFLTGSAALFVYAAARRMRPPRPRDVPGIFLHGFLGFFCYHVALNYGEQTVSAGSACFIIGFIPVFSTILAVLFLGERVSGRSVIGIAVSVAGVALISLAEGGGASIDIGALFVLFAALAESVFFVLIKPRLSRYGAVEYTTHCIFAGTLLLLVFSPGLHAAVIAAPPGATLAAIYLGVFPTAVAYATWTFALSRAPLSRIAATQYVMPGATIAIAWLWLGELPSLLALAGGVVALFGVFLVSTRPGMVGAGLERLRALGRRT